MATLAEGRPGLPSYLQGRGLLGPVRGIDVLKALEGHRLNAKALEGAVVRFERAKMQPAEWRFSLNAQPDHIGDVTRAMVSSVLDNPEYNVSLVKTFGPRVGYALSGNVIVYGSGNEGTLVGPLRALAQQNPHWFREGTAMMMEPVAKGIGFGQEPRSNYMSFSAVRAHAIAEALGEARANQVPGVAGHKAFVAELDSTLRWYELDPLRPARNLPAHTAPAAQSPAGGWKAK